MVALYFASLQNEWGWVIGAFALSLFFAHLSYKFIETPTRQYLSQANLFKEILLIISVGTVIGLSAISVKFFVFSERTKPSVDIAAREVLNRNSEVIDCTPKMSEMGYVEGCQFGEDKLGALLIGDSHAQAIAGGFIKASKNNSKSIIYRAMPGCSSILNAEKYLKPNEYYRKEACKKFNVDGLNILKELDRSVPLIIVNRFNTAIVGANEKEYSEEAKVFIKKNLKENLTKLISTACLYQKNRQVYLMRSTPEMGVNIPRKLSINKLLGHDIHAVQITLEEYHKRNRLVWEAQDKAVKQCGVKILNPLPYLCDDQYCYGSKNGRPLYYDDDHLSEYGNKFLVPMFEEIFKSNPQN